MLRLQGIVVFLLGCGGPSPSGGPVAIGPPSGASEKISDLPASYPVIGKPTQCEFMIETSQGNKRTAVKMSEKFRVSGQFHLDDATTSAPPVLARAVRVTGKERVIFSNNVMIPDPPDSGGNVRFKLELDSPSEKGEYVLELVGNDDHVFASKPLLVE